MWAVEHAYQLVALRKESVDRNLVMRMALISFLVALRKESVDRNKDTQPAEQVKVLSLSARRAWIEILSRLMLSARPLVALRKESVDRNFHTVQIVIVVMSRSPQGERG